MAAVIHHFHILEMFGADEPSKLNNDSQPNMSPQLRVHMEAV